MRCVLLLALVASLCHAQNRPLFKPAVSKLYYTRIKYPSKTEFYVEMIQWVEDRAMTEFRPDQALLDIIRIVLTRLGIFEMSMPCPPSPQRSEFLKRSLGMPNRDQIDISSRMILAKFTDPDKGNDSLSNVFYNEATFFQFCEEVLHHAVTFSPCCPMFWCPELSPDYHNFASLMTSVRHKYIRDALIPFKNVSNALKYTIEAHANRLLCVRDDDIKHYVRTPRLIYTEINKRVWSTAIVFNILKGYQIVDNDTPCPIEYIQQIYRHHGGMGAKISSFALGDMLHKLATKVDDLEDSDDPLQQHPPQSSRLHMFPFLDNFPEQEDAAYEFRRRDLDDVKDDDRYIPTVSEATTERAYKNADVDANTDTDTMVYGMDEAKRPADRHTSNRRVADQEDVHVDPPAHKDIGDLSSPGYQAPDTKHLGSGVTHEYKSDRFHSRSGSIQGQTTSTGATVDVSDHRYISTDVDPFQYNYPINNYQRNMMSFLHNRLDHFKNDIDVDTMECQSAYQLSMMYTGSKLLLPIPHITMTQFEDMCPAILHHILAGKTGCWHSFPTMPPHTTTTKDTGSGGGKVTTKGPGEGSTTPAGNGTDDHNVDKLSTSQSYLFGSISTLIISLASTFGAAFMKITRVNVRNYVMAAMLSLAVGCLVADAALHLLPEVLMSEHHHHGGEEVHDDHEHEDAEEDVFFPEYLQKLCALLGSVYAFFILELCLSTKQKHSHGPVDSESMEAVKLKYMKAIQDKNLNSSYTVVHNNHLQVPTPGASRKAAVSPMGNQSPLRKQINTDNGSTTTPIEDAATSHNAIQVEHEVNSLTVSLSTASDRISDRISVHDVPYNLKALAWMIIIGDGIHNFADGLALGAAFALTFTKGLSISITILCHEVPHELGDFAVLISTGMSIRKALFLNFLSSLTAFAGLYVGLAIGAQEEASTWIFSVTAGMFLYVALTDLIPECKDHYKRNPTLMMFIAQNIGILLGYATMLLLALYEEKLTIST